ncbi:CPBP family glutamic-type intramembrane protease [Metabacillus idriensis]|uniref:CPBP family glutamic-type intramembrane protease n=1 Tax=Metabacillus idriensis TaxID=324768 RepID=UPI002812F04B|nr:CPBP family glutamic-type intramembrane protease [Metabacillus idriensis]MDR0136572.1 CPBP family glutamic-type intramembrane protease [Metabacillus idriensis]
MKKTDLKLALLIGVICFGAGFLLVPYQMNAVTSVLPASELENMTGEISVGFLSLMTGIQLFITSFILSWIGFKLARKTGFSFEILQSLVEKGPKKWFCAKALLLAVLLGTVTGFIIAGGDRFYFEKHIPQIEAMNPEFSWIGLFAGALYGGVFEETMLRLFFVSLLVWVFIKIFKRENSTFYWAAIIIAALVFAGAHLPFTNLLFGELTGLIIFRCFLLNGIGAIFFGWLYWKKGFEYAIVSHMFAHISMQLLFIPLFY